VTSDCRSAFELCEGSLDGGGGGEGEVGTAFGGEAAVVEGNCRSFMRGWLILVNFMTHTILDALDV
jgi:hypothetical protein